MAEGESPARSLAFEGPATVGPIQIASLYAALAPELRRFVLGVVRDPDLADDVMQATFVKAVERGHEARPETYRGWLFRVAFHEALASRRRASARETGQRRLADFRARPDDPPDAPLIRAEAVAAVREGPQGPARGTAEGGPGEDGRGKDLRRDRPRDGSPPGDRADPDAARPGEDEEDPDTRRLSRCPSNRNPTSTGRPSSTSLVS